MNVHEHGLTWAIQEPGHRERGLQFKLGVREHEAECPLVLCTYVCT